MTARIVSNIEMLISLCSSFALVAASSSSAGSPMPSLGTFSCSAEWAPACDESQFLQVRADAVAAHEIRRGRRSILDPVAVETRAHFPAWKWTFPLAFAVIGGSVPVLWRDPRGISFAIGAMIFFGLQHFLIGLSADAQHPYAAECYIAMMCAYNCLSALMLHLVGISVDPNYMATLKQLRKVPGKARVSLLCPGIFMICAQVFCQIGFGQDLNASGQHLSVVAADAILVSLFFYSFFGEGLTEIQVGGMAHTLVGIVIMGSGCRVVTLKALLYIFGALCCYAGNVICLRLSAIWGAPAIGVTVVRMTCMSLFGFIWLALRWSTIGVSAPFPEVWAMSLACALAEGIGLVCLTMSFAAPGCTTAVSVCIFGSCSVIMTLLNVIVVGTAAPLETWVGMIVVLAGNAMLMFETTLYQDYDVNAK